MTKTFPLLCAALLVLTACAATSVTVNTYDAPQQAPTAEAKVAILKSMPDRETLRLGQIVVDTSWSQTPLPDAIQTRLRREGARLGADAVVVVYDDLIPVSAYSVGARSNPENESNPRRRTIGVAIKYR